MEFKWINLNKFKKYKNTINETMASNGFTILNMIYKIMLIIMITHIQDDIMVLDKLIEYVPKDCWN
jgi:hypothetical protein